MKTKEREGIMGKILRQCNSAQNLLGLAGISMLPAIILYLIFGEDTTMYPDWVRIAFLFFIPLACLLLVFGFIRTIVSASTLDKAEKRKEPFL